SIIESGIDMPRVNTLIVNEADRMGLAQLYQLRGRVGRSNRLAYSYFTYRQDKSLTEPATKRLNAIREFTELGSGMKIAMRDLEIRGAGNLLGPEQHGHIEAIGFDLYVRLLEEECARLRGQEKTERVMPQLDVKIDSFIPDDYIPDPAIKIQIYKQALLAVSETEVQNLEDELQDRFGPLPAPVQNLIRITRLRAQAADKHIRSVTTLKNRLEVRVDVNLNDIWRPLQALAVKRNLRLKRLGMDGFALEGNVADISLLQAMIAVL
ncbi:MAG: TRCF domain-containing protein, partial [Methanomassiliicoccales archaeon]